MTDKELYQQKKQAQLDGWKAEIDKLKAKASKANANVQLEMNKQIKLHESRSEEIRAKLLALTTVGNEEWESARKGIEAAWDSLQSAFSNAASTDSHIYGINF